LRIPKISLYAYLYYFLLLIVILAAVIVINPFLPYNSMDIQAFIGEMERVAPPVLAEEFDQGRIGLIIEGRPEINRICCALDATPVVVKRAVSASADMLVVHHTPLWTPVTQLCGRTARILRILLAAEMNLYVMHTNFDRADGGVNDVLCHLLDLTKIAPMSVGRIGTFGAPAAEISRRIGGNIRVWGKIGKTVHRLAVVAGSGFDPELIEEAHVLGADAFLSAEMKHAVARGAPIPCIEATHYSLEAPAMRDLGMRMGWEYIDDPPVIRQLT
jgi:dinuclear metal center YbgI/SA1388 family protein